MNRKIKTGFCTHFQEGCDVGNCAPGVYDAEHLHALHPDSSLLQFTQEAKHLQKSAVRMLITQTFFYTGYKLEMRVSQQENR